jgi:hypothetical protein
MSKWLHSPKCVSTLQAWNLKQAKVKMNGWFWIVAVALFPWVQSSMDVESLPHNQCLNPRGDHNRLDLLQLQLWMYHRSNSSTKYQIMRSLELCAWTCSDLIFLAVEDVTSWKCFVCGNNYESNSWNHAQFAWRKMQKEVQRILKIKDSCCLLWIGENGSRGKLFTA